MSIESHPIFQRYSAGQRASDRFFLTSQNGSRAILYQDSTLRWCHVSDSEYRFMQLESFSGEVRSAILSDSGDFLCLYSDSELRIIEVPWGYNDVSSIAKAFHKFHYTVASNEPKIKQVLYHPLAYEEDSIVILKYDDSIGILNWKDGGLSQDILNQYNKTFGVDTLICEIESISFSTDKLTLYALSISEGGDIYAFYPCLPSRISIAKEKLELLVHKSLVQYDSLKVETPAEGKRNTIKQMQFVSRLHKISSEGEHAASGNYKLDIPFEQRQVRGQGPFTVVPFPDRFYSCTCKEMAVLPIDESNELLIMTLDEGTIAILFKDVEMTMNWDSNPYSYNNSLVLIETIKLDVKDIGKLVVSSNFGQFFILGNKSTHLIDTTKWTTLMSTCINNSDLRPLGELEIESEVIPVDYKGSFNSVALWDCPEELSYVFVSSNDHVVTKSTDITESRRDKKGKEVKTGSQPPSHTYKVKFSQPMAEITALNQSFQRDTAMPPSKLIKPQQRQAPLANESNEEQLDILTGISREFLSKIAKGQSLGLVLHNRIVEQQLELTRQLKFSSDIMERQALLLENYDPQCSKGDANLSRQTVLASRLNKLSDTLNKINESAKFKELEINNKEMEWFREIRDQILTFNQYVHNQKTLQEQTFYLKKELNRIKNETTNVHEKSRDDWEELRKMLEDDIKIIKDCNSQLIRASNDVETKTTA